MITRLLKRKGSKPASRDQEDYPELLAVRQPGPDFSLPAVSRGKDDGDFTLSDFRGQPVVLVFYPADNSSVCSSQLALYSEALPLVEDHDARLVGISVDTLESHRDFAADLKLDFPLLSDDDPAGEVAKAYGVFDESAGVCERALYVIDADGQVHWRYVSPRKVNPGMDGILAALDSLQ